MTGNKFNKTESGQVLLITIMLLATTLTVVMTNAFKSITDTQVTKLEEDSQKALAAAEAGIEKSLDQKNSNGVPAPISIGAGELSGIETVSTTATTAQGKLYTTPLLTKDSQYTFYLSSYPNLTSYWKADTFNILYFSENSEPTLEITFVKNDNSVIRKIVQDELITTIEGNNFSRPIDSVNTVEGITFKKYAHFTLIDNYKLVIIRVLGAATKLGFSTSATELPKQGEVISSEAKTTTNVVKKVELRQSYPQIPAEFFVTSF